MFDMNQQDDGMDKEMYELWYRGFTAGLASYRSHMQWALPFLPIAYESAKDRDAFCAFAQEAKFGKAK